MSAVVTPTRTHEEETEHPSRGVGWYGMVFFLASEAVFFANLIASYLYLRVRTQGSTGWPPKGIDHLDITLPLSTQSSCWRVASRCTLPGGQLPEATSAAYALPVPHGAAGRDLPQRPGLGVYSFRVQPVHEHLWLGLLHVDRVPRRARDGWCALLAGVLLPLDTRRLHQGSPLRRDGGRDVLALRRRGVGHPLHGALPALRQHHALP